jgi:hypothetical protein
MNNSPKVIFTNSNPASNFTTFAITFALVVTLMRVLIGSGDQPATSDNVTCAKFDNVVVENLSTAGVKVEHITDRAGSRWFVDGKFISAESGPTLTACADAKTIAKIEKAQP